MELQEFIFVKTRENGPSTEKFCHYAPETPHIYLVVILQAQDNFWCTIESGLHIGEGVHPERRG